MKTPAWAKRLMKRRTRVYIMPTRMGGYLNGLIFLMFLLSVGYSNNLLLIFALVLFGFNLVWVLQTHFNLQNLKFHHARIENGFAQGRGRVFLTWKNPSDFANRFELFIDNGGIEQKIQLMDADHESAVGEVSLPSRGLRVWEHLLATTELPFGLYRVWIYYPLKTSSLIYPALLKDETSSHTFKSHRDGEEASDHKGSEGFRDLVPYEGSESRKIHWKHYARSGELFIREGEELKSSMIQLKLELPVSEIELSKLATQMVNCHRKKIPFSFKGSRTFGPGYDQELLDQCLTELALC